jgi:2-(3-amino-3-carboxypropyl)histidine synthase
MEEDRAETNLGPSMETEATIEEEAVTRIPKKRFIGKRAAAAKLGTDGDLNATIENSGTIQRNEARERLKGHLK